MDVKTEQPMVSIVTPSYNQGMFIEETIQSILGQDYPNIEYVVIDGKSTDNTLEILKKYEDRLTWISEPDNGQSDAINKGFKMARGEILSWVNSDDALLPGAVRRAVDYFNLNPGVMMLYGEGNEIDEKSRIIKRFPATQEFDLWKLIYASDYILQPTVFLRRGALDTVGLLDTSLGWCMDWDMWIRIGKRCKIGYLPVLLANSRVYSNTKTASGGFKRFREIAKVMRRHGNKRYPPGYFSYGEDTLESVLIDKCPGLYHLFLKPFLLYLRHLFNRMASGGIQGFYSDGWVKRKAHFLLSLNDKPVTACRLVIEGFSTGPFNLEVRVNGSCLAQHGIVSSGEFTVGTSIPLGATKGTILEIDLHSSRAARLGPNDHRRAAFRLRQMKLDS